MFTTGVAEEITQRETQTILPISLQRFMKANKPDISYFTALFLKELGVNLLADDLGADVVLHSNAKSHLFKYKLDFLLLFHGAISLNLSMG